MNPKQSFKNHNDLSIQSRVARKNKKRRERERENNHFSRENVRENNNKFIENNIRRKKV